MQICSCSIEKDDTVSKRQVSTNSISSSEGKKQTREKARRRGGYIRACPRRGIEHPTQAPRRTEETRKRLSSSQTARRTSGSASCCWTKKKRENRKKRKKIERDEEGDSTEKEWK
jgi:hypothetical protein